MAKKAKFENTDLEEYYSYGCKILNVTSILLIYHVLKFEVHKIYLLDVMRIFVIGCVVGSVVVGN